VSRAFLEVHASTLAIDFLEYISPNVDGPISIDSEDVRIESGVMNTAES
jgi:hypothetical protein